jgi:hypothetical protein
VRMALQRVCAFQFDPSPDGYFGCRQSILPAVQAGVEDNPVLEWLPYGCRCVWGFGFGACPTKSVTYATSDRACCTDWQH